MKFITLDFETHYDKQYSLRKMTPAEYILDARYETICCAVQVDQGPIDCIDGPDFAKWLGQYPASESISLTFNALFDNCILAWRYGWVPARMVDGLGMARALLGHKLRRLSLEAVSEHLELGTKGNTLKTVLGMRRSDIIAAGLWPAFQAYAMGDVRLLRALFDRLAPSFPKDEYRVMDLVLRCCVQPRFVMNVPKLEAHYAAVVAEKAKLLDEAFSFADTTSEEQRNEAKAQLMSGPEFAKMLYALGVDVEMKRSAAGNMIPALAKTDDFMNELAEHEDPRVQALAAARLGFKSTLEEKRCERLISIAKLPWHIAGLPAGTMPIPLRYSGAHTHRLSGDWKINMQNLPSGRGTASSTLRDCLEAPPGHKVVVCDLGQIEARLTAWLTRAPLLSTFLEGKDPYCAMASEIFKFPVTKANEIERFVGKSAVLGLGFGLGKANFFVKTAAAARAQGVAIGDRWTQELADDTVATYRMVQQPTVRFWQILDHHLRGAWLGTRLPATIGPITIGLGYVEGPGKEPGNNLRMQYHVLEFDGRFVFEEKGYLHPHWGDYKYAGRWRNLWGGAFLENIIQFLARIIQMNAALRLEAIGRKADLPFLRMAHTVHDELIFVVPDRYVDKVKQIVHGEMIRRPSWGQDIPLKADVTKGLAQSYGDAK